MAREYQPIWNKLKQNKVVKITANKALHPRIIKAVIKEKWMDVGYKLEIEPKKAKLSYTSTHSVIEFTLHHSLTAEDF